MHLTIQLGALSKGELVNNSIILKLFLSYSFVQVLYCYKSQYLFIWTSAQRTIFSGIVSRGKLEQRECFKIWKIMQNLERTIYYVLGSPYTYHFEFITKFKNSQNLDPSKILARKKKNYLEVLFPHFQNTIFSKFKGRKLDWFFTSFF